MKILIWVYDSNMNDNNNRESADWLELVFLEGPSINACFLGIVNVDIDEFLYISYFLWYPYKIWCAVCSLQNPHALSNSTVWLCDSCITGSCFVKENMNPIFKYFQCMKYWIEALSKPDGDYILLLVIKLRCLLLWHGL